MPHLLIFPSHCPGPASVRLLMLKARPHIEARLKTVEDGRLTFEDLRPALESIKEASELRDLAKDPTPLIAKLTRGPSVSAQNAATGTTQWEPPAAAAATPISAPRPNPTAAPTPSPSRQPLTLTLLSCRSATG